MTTQHRDNPLTPQGSPDLAPLRESIDIDQVSAELKAIFIQMFGDLIRPAAADLRVIGLPHLGSDEQFRRGVRNEGLALYSTTDTEAMRRVLRAWRASNPKRGMALLRAYLQMLWPNAWTAVQQWQSKSSPYPLGLADADGGNHYLTSRVHVEIAADVAAAGQIQTVASALRSVLPARMVLTINLQSQYRSQAAIAMAGAVGVQVQYFEGVAV